ncbi:MAG: GyrI-like domain-containing protein [Cyanobacteria bacterium]|nr:GyrI-like domain-containing protein [Cyanobacteriota bacterium]
MIDLNSNYRAALESAFGGSMDVTIVNQPELRVAGIRHIGPYSEIGREFGRLGYFLNGPPPAGSQMIALYHDDPDTTPTANLRSDAGLTLPAGAPCPSGLIEHRAPAGKYARTVHKGGYEGLPGAWNELKKEWLPANGYRGSASYEIYVNNPTTTEQSELLTEIYLRID